MSVAIIGIATTVVSVGLTAYGAVQKNKAAKKAASAAEQAAEYNAAVDNAQADQIQLDTEYNTALAERQGKNYISRQQVSYAAAGVLADTGTPLQAEVASVGAMNQKIQQDYSNAQRQQMMLHGQAAQGILTGQAQASSYKAQGTAALLDGGASIAGQLFHAYDSGVFSRKGGDDPMPTGEEMLQGG